MSDGIVLVYENLLKLLESEDCHKIECHIGDTFDVAHHEAVSVVQGQDSDML